MRKRAQMPGDRIKGLIAEFIATSPANTMGTEAGEPAWEDALVGFASGADPIWQQYKEYIGPFHWTPWEVFTQHHPEEPARPEELTVVSWVLPQREVVRRANRRAKKYPSEEWARIRVYGEEFNVALRRHLVQSLERAGKAAIAPMLAPNWTIVKSQRFSYASSWSERHAAHAAGLGTFGLCDGLITARGKAMRAGSVVARIAVDPTPRPYAHHRAYCLYFAEGPAADASTAARSGRLPRPATTKRSVGNIWSGPESMSKKPISSWAMVAGCARWACLARRVSRSRPPGRPWSAASCRPPRRPWPEDTRSTQGIVIYLRRSWKLEICQPFKET